MRRRTKRRIIRGVIAALGLWIVLAGLLLVLGANDTRQAKDDLDAVQASTNAEGLRSGKAEDALSDLNGSLDAAHWKFDNPLLWPIRPIPFLGKQLDSAISLSGAGAKASDVGVDTLSKADGLQELAKTDRAKALAEVSVVCAEGSQELSKIDLGPKTGLIGPLEDVRTDADKQLRSLQTGLVKGGAASAGLAQLLGKPGNYLLLAANNGEMRNGSGMFLQAGKLETGNNKLKVSDLGSSTSRRIPNSQITYPEDLQKNWGWLANQGTFQDLMLSPRFDVSAPLAKQIWEKGGHGNVDGVIALDIATMKALLATTGPVTVEGITYTSDNVLPQLLFEQYKLTTSAGGNAERKELLADVATATFDKFASGDWNFAAGARELGQAALGRHVLIWSAEKQLNERWISAGVNGDVQANDTTVGVINLGTNKLDQFLKVDSTMEVNKTVRTVDTTLRITLKNEAPPDGPSYVLGGTANADLQPGAYRGMLSMTLPADATNARFDSNLPLSVAGFDGINPTLATAVDVPRGNTQNFVLHYSRPSSVQSTMVKPSARIPGIQWHYKGTNWEDEAIHRVDY